MQKQMVKDKREGKSIEGEVDCRLILASLHSLLHMVFYLYIQPKGEKENKTEKYGKTQKQKGGARELVPASKKLVLRMMAKNP